MATPLPGPPAGPPGKKRQAPRGLLKTGDPGSQPLRSALLPPALRSPSTGQRLRDAALGAEAPPVQRRRLLREPRGAGRPPPGRPVGAPGVTGPSAQPERLFGHGAPPRPARAPAQCRRRAGRRARAFPPSLSPPPASGSFRAVQQVGRREMATGRCWGC